MPFVIIGIASTPMIGRSDEQAAKGIGLGFYDPYDTNLDPSDDFRKLLLGSPNSDPESKSKSEPDTYKPFTAFFNTAGLNTDSMQTKTDSMQTKPTQPPNPGHIERVRPHLHNLLNPAPAAPKGNIDDNSRIGG